MSIVCPCYVLVMSMLCPCCVPVVSRLCHLEKQFFIVYFDVFSLLNVLSTNMEEVANMTYSAASHQVAMEILWLH